MNDLLGDGGDVEQGNRRGSENAPVAQGGSLRTASSSKGSSKGSSGKKGASSRRAVDGGGNGKKKKKPERLMEEEAEEGEGDEEAGEQEASPHMQQFFEDINEVKNDLQAMRKRLRLLQELNDKSKLVTKAKDMKDIKKKMEGAIHTVLRVAKEIKAKLEALDKENMLSRKRPGCEEGTGTDRTRMSITMTHKKKLKDIMVEFQELRGKIQQEYKETVERRYFTVTGEKPDPELLEQLTETGDGEAIFQRAIEDQGRGQLTDAIAEIQERADAVKDIEAQLKELHEMFLDMAVVVESQGEILDNIATNVDGARDHVSTGVKKLTEARTLQLNTRKWLFIGLTAVVIIIIVVIIVALQPWTWH